MISTFLFAGNGQRGIPGATENHSYKGSKGEKGTKGEAVGRYFKVPIE